MPRIDSPQAVGMLLARICLGLAWLLPILSILLNNVEIGLNWPLLASGVGITASSRTLLCLLSFLACVLSWPNGKVSKSHLALFTVGFSTTILLACLASSAPFDSLLFSQIWFASIFFAVAVKNCVPSPSTSLRAIFLHTPVAFIAAASLLPLLFEPDFHRISGPFFLAGVLSNWLVLLFPILLHDLWQERGLCAASAGISAALALTAIVFTFSRAGWLVAAMELSLGLLLLHQPQIRRLILWLGFLLAGLVTVAFLRAQFSPVSLGIATFALFATPVVLESLRRRVPHRALILTALLLLSSSMLFVGLSAASPKESVGEMAKDRISSLQNNDNSVQARVQLWKSAVSMTLQNPLLGVGPREFSNYYPRYQRKFYYYSDSPHSSFLELSSEVGLLGLGFCLAMLVSWLKLYQGQVLSSVQRLGLLGLLGAGCYAQVEVSYQFGYLWLSFFGLASFFGLSQEPENNEVSKGLPLRMGLGLSAVSLAIWLLPPLTWNELAQRESDSGRALSLYTAAWEKLPWWQEAALRTFQQGVWNNAPPSQLQAQVSPLLAIAPDTAVAHGLVGQFLAQSGNIVQAETELRKALDLDPFNQPFLYLELFNLAKQSKDESKANEVLERVLKVYALDKIPLAHSAHREHLKKQLNPLFYSIAEYLNPYENPKKTEPLYRYLLEEKTSAQALHGLGASLWSLGRPQEAWPYLEKAHQVNPSYPRPPQPRRQTRGSKPDQGQSKF